MKTPFILDVNCELCKLAVLSELTAGLLPVTVPGVVFLGTGLAVLRSGSGGTPSVISGLALRCILILTKTPGLAECT